ncbi:MAG: hypothetical protein PWQ77_730 [Kosmotogales bacterium]|nr:hypothetical protein [Kosmotogales bacterium]
MNIKIFYFSGTGNSLYVAKEIKKYLKDSEIIPIAKCMLEEEFNFDFKKIGFVFPVYYMGLPKIVEDFVKSAKFRHAEYIFALATRGSSLSGGTLKMLNKCLEEKSRSLNYGRYITFFSNFIPEFKIPPEEKQLKIIADNEEIIYKYAHEIYNETKSISGNFSDFFAEKYHKKYIKDIKNSFMYFHVDKKLCNNCGLCEQICPTNSIILDDLKNPLWKNNCTLCLSCLHHCPKNAIDYKHMTKNKERYSNPKISPKELIDQKK